MVKERANSMKCEVYYIIVENVECSRIHVVYDIYVKIIEYIVYVKCIKCI